MKKKKDKYGDDVQITIKSERTPDDDVIMKEDITSAADVLKMLSANRKKSNNIKRRRK